MVGASRPSFHEFHTMNWTAMAILYLLLSSIRKIRGLREIRGFDVRFINDQFIQMRKPASPLCHRGPRLPKESSPTWRKRKCGSGHAGCFQFLTEKNIYSVLQKWLPLLILQSFRSISDIDIPGHIFSVLEYLWYEMESVPNRKCDGQIFKSGIRQWMAGML